MAVGTTVHTKSTDVDKFPEHSYLYNSGLNTHRATRNDIKPNDNTFQPEGPDVNALAMTSTNVFVYANGEIVGMIQSFSVSEKRNVEQLQALGTEGVIQAVPNNTNGGTLNVNRIALYSSNLWNALGLSTSGHGYDKSGAIVYNSVEQTNPTPNSADDKSARNNPNWDIPQQYTNNVEDRNLTTNTRYVFKTLKDQRVPLEIQVRTPLTGQGVFGAGSGAEAGNQQLYYTETYVDCWLSSYSKSYDVGKITVAESCSIDYADVY